MAAVTSKVSPAMQPAKSFASPEPLRPSENIDLMYPTHLKLPDILPSLPFQIDSTMVRTLIM